MCKVITKEQLGHNPSLQGTEDYALTTMFYCLVPITAHENNYLSLQSEPTHLEELPRMAEDVHVLLKLGAAMQMTEG